MADTDRSSSGQWEFGNVLWFFTTVLWKLGITVKWDCVTDATRDPWPHPTIAVKTMPGPRVTSRYKQSINGGCIGTAWLALIQHRKNWRWLSLSFYEKETKGAQSLQ